MQHLTATDKDPQRWRATGPLLAEAAVLMLWAHAPAQAQMFHLILQCQGSVAAGLQATKPGEAPIVAPRGAEAIATATADVGSDKNAADGNENIQARARAVRGAAKTGSAQLELALRDNNMTAFVQRSNVLPTGERMKYTATQTHYTATYRPQASGLAGSEWRASWLFSWHPPFQKLAAARLSIDRQSGQLEGEIVGPAGEILGLIDMQCEPRRDADGPAPRF